MAAALFWTIAWFAAPPGMHAFEPERGMPEYIRTHWGSSEGFPGGQVYAITQAHDGYLWIAAEKGLVRFDGLTFRLVQPVEAASGVDPVALELAPAAGRALWALLRRGAVVRFSNGTYEDDVLGPAWQGTRVTAIAPGLAGTVLIAEVNRGLVVAGGSALETVVPSTALTKSFVTSMAQTDGGAVWLGTRDAGLITVNAGRVIRVSSDLPDQKINCLASDTHDGLWIGTDSGVWRWSGGRVTRDAVPEALAHVRVRAIVSDRDANLWIAASDGLYRLTAVGEISLDRRPPPAAVTTLFEDRDGNLWIGTTTGIERWRPGMFTTFAAVDTVTGGGNAGPVFVDAAERVWFAPPGGGLFWTRNGRVDRVTAAGLDGDVVYSIAGTGDDLWVGRQHRGLTRLRAASDGFTARTFTTANGLAQDNVYAVHAARDGSIWAGTLSGGVSRFKDGRFTTFTTADGLASNTVVSIVDAADGTMWFATPNGASSLSNSAWRRYSTVDGLPSNDVVSLLEDSDHNVWLGTALGLAVVRGSSVHAGLRLPASLRGPILGLAEDTAHWLWVSTADHVLHVDRGRLLDGTLADADVAEFGAADGLRGVEGVKRDRSLTMDARGRVWVSTSGGLAMADPTRVARWTAPALVTVEDVSVDGRSVGAADGVVIQPRRQRITFEFAGLSLSVPERVRYRYRLDGFDDDWSGPGSTRQAAYTNLGHGPYRFRVIASNGDGVWNSQEATLSFSIAPALWETTRFRVSAGLLLIAAVLAVHRLNVMRAVRKLNARFDERLAERTRIARDLHDTLLQTFHGVLFQFQAATNRLPDSDIKKQFENSIDQAAQAITEGRDAVKNLRSSSIDATDLPTSISTLGRELASAVPSDDATANRPVVDVAVEGTPRDLHPVIRDDVYRIAAEALRNAFRHAHARRIEANIRYDDRHLTLRVRDDGKGMDPKILAEYRHGHFGLPGMRERAQVVGGHLDVWSQLGAGTEVELTIPAAAAYTAARTRDRWSFFTRKAGTSS